MPGTVLTATFTGAGSVIVNDDAAVLAIANQTAAITANTAALATQLELQFGKTALTPLGAGGLTSIVSGQAKSVELIYGRLGGVITQLENLTTAISGVNKSQADVLTALANIHYVAVQTKTIQTMTFVAQVDNNKFQQNATNAALKEAGKPPIKVEPADLTAETLKMVESVGIINGQVAATNIIEDYVTSSITQGLLISKQWIAQTAFGTFVSDYYAIAKLQTQLLYADAKTARTIEEQINVIRQRRLNIAA